MDKTETFPQGERTYYYGADMITAIRLLGTDVELALLNGKAIYMLGRDADVCDLPLNISHLSSAHLRIERVPNSDQLRIQDVSSGKNQTVYENAATRLFWISAGDTFTIGSTTFYALNDQMRLMRPELAEVFGAANHEILDNILITSIKRTDAPVVLTGETGSLQDVVARAIHHMSRRRQNRCIEAEATKKPGTADLRKVDQARGGTLLIFLPSNGRFDPHFIGAVARENSRIRLVVCAHSLKKAQASFPEHVLRDAVEIRIPNLKSRRQEIPALLDKYFITNESPLRFELLKDTVQRRLMAYHWEGNLQELHEAAGFLDHLSHYKSERQATKDTALTRKASRYWRAKVGLPIPILDEHLIDQLNQAPTT